MLSIPFSCVLVAYIVSKRNGEKEGHKKLRQLADADEFQQHRFIIGVEK